MTEGAGADGREELGEDVLAVAADLLKSRERIGRSVGVTCMKIGEGVEPGVLFVRGGAGEGWLGGFFAIFCDEGIDPNERILAGVLEALVVE